jgi:ketopantoate reductase
VQLARARADVSLVARGAQLAAMRESGLRLPIGDEELVVQRGNPSRLWQSFSDRGAVEAKSPVFA